MFQGKFETADSITGEVEFSPLVGDLICSGTLPSGSAQLVFPNASIVPAPVLGRPAITSHVRVDVPVMVRAAAVRIGGLLPPMMPLSGTPVL